MAIRIPPHSAAKIVDSVNYRLDHAHGWFPKARLHPRWGFYYAASEDICAEAAKRGIPPELMIDEEFYYQRSGGVMGYRLLFECHKQGRRMSDVLTAADNTYGMKVRARRWRNFLEGHVHIQHYTHTREPCDYAPRYDRRYAGVSIGYLQTVCEILHFPLGEVFRAVRLGGTRKNEGRGIYAGVHKAIGKLDDVDLAVLTGVGLLLATNDTQIIKDGLDRLLLWRGEQRNGTVASAKTASS